jgi:hypothetical protein
VQEGSHRRVILWWFRSHSEDKYEAVCCRGLAQPFRHPFRFRLRLPRYRDWKVSANAGEVRLLDMTQTRARYLNWHLVTHHNAAEQLLAATHDSTMDSIPRRPHHTQAGVLVENGGARKTPRWSSAWSLIQVQAPNASHSEHFHLTVSYRLARHNYRRRWTASRGKTCHHSLPLRTDLVDRLALYRQSFLQLRMRRKFA